MTSQKNPTNHRGETVVHIQYTNTLQHGYQKFETATEAAYFVRKIMAPRFTSIQKIRVASENGVVTTWEFQYNSPNHDLAACWHKHVESNNQVIFHGYVGQFAYLNATKEEVKSRLDNHAHETAILATDDRPFSIWKN